jgi:uncharacterized DUF497 family protein
MGHDRNEYVGALMVVVWTDREDDVRLISVREPEPKERRSYEKGI